MKRDYRRLKRRGKGWVCEAWNGTAWVSRSLFPRNDPRLRDPSQSDPRLQRAWERFSLGKPVGRHDATHRARELAAEVLEATLRAAPLALTTIVDEEIHGVGKGGRQRQRSTKNCIKKELERFRDWIAEHHPAMLEDYRRITRGVAHEFVHRHLVELDLADGSRRNAKAYLHRMISGANERHGEAVGEIVNPFAKVTVPAVSQDEKRREIEQERALTDDEIERLIAAAGDGQAPAYLKPFLVLALSTGCRRGELLATVRYDRIDGKRRTFRSGLLWKDIHWDGGYLSVSGKTGARDVPLVAEAVEALQEYRRTLIEAGMLRNDVFIADRLGKDGKPQPIIDPRRGAFHGALRRAGIHRDIRIHDLRHSALSFYARRGMPSHALRDLAGHSSLRVTDIYMHSRRDEILDAVARARKSDQDGARSGAREQSGPASLPVTHAH